MEPKLLTRDEFREAVFARDGYRCVFCGIRAEDTPEKKLDAHHIIERRLWGNGGYYLDNGATVCEKHHLECEQATISVEQVREAAVNQEGDAGWRTLFTDPTWEGKCNTCHKRFLLKIDLRTNRVERIKPYVVIDSKTTVTTDEAPFEPATQFYHDPSSSDIIPF